MADLLQSIGADGICLGDHSETALYAEQATDVEMFLGLWLDTLVRCNDEHHGIDAPSARQHVTNEERVSWHIDEADGHRLTVRQLRLERSEAKVDGYASPLLLRQAIGIHPGKSTDECRLSVIDMTGSADHDGIAE